MKAVLTFLVAVLVLSVFFTLAVFLGTTHWGLAIKMGPAAAAVVALIGAIPSR